MLVTLLNVIQLFSVSSIFHSQFTTLHHSQQRNQRYPEHTPIMSFLGLEGFHVFITGAAGGIGGQAVKEFLGMSCIELSFC
jgi:FlaA1/EpsC-like NDP-sugar epimerase